MLVSVDFTDPDPITLIMARTMPGLHGIAITEVQKGVYLSGLNLASRIEGETVDYPEFHPEMIAMAARMGIEQKSLGKQVGPEILESLHRKPLRAREGDHSGYLNSYGVVDSAAQLLALYDFEGDPRQLVITLSEVRRENCSPEGGWRWHKWGPYFGDQNPQHEYLYDEEHIDSIFLFYVTEIVPRYGLPEDDQIEVLLIDGTGGRAFKGPLKHARAAMQMPDWMHRDVLRAFAEKRDYTVRYEGGTTSKLIRQ